MSGQLTLGKADPLPHTPGPWRVARKSDGHGWTVVGPSPREHDRPMEWMVCRTVSDEPEDEANVRLIVCAPELLQMCHAVGDVLFNYRLAQEDPRVNTLLLELRALIVKAEGR